jgi:hypothetical protein
MKSRRVAALPFMLCLAACAAHPVPVPAACGVPAAGVITVTLLDHGWHTDIGVPADALTGRLALFRSVFPGVKSVVFSFGKRTFLTAPADDWTEYILGPVPGPAAILVTGLNVPAAEGYGSDAALVLPLPPGGAARLSEFLWGEFAKDKSGRPRLLDRASFEGGLFYRATGTYTLARTCNAWSAEALAAAGLPVSPDGVIFAHQVVDRAAAACAAPRS